MLTCPACNGTRERGGRQCNNCGGQTMDGVATGTTFPRKDGTACLHDYRCTRRTRTLVEYQCLSCPSNYVIDSGD